VYPAFRHRRLESFFYFATARVVTERPQHPRQSVRTGDAAGNARLSVLVEEVDERVAGALVEGGLPQPRSMHLGEHLAGFERQQHLGRGAVVGPAIRDHGKVLASLHHVGPLAIARGDCLPEVAQPLEGGVIDA